MEVVSVLNVALIHRIGMARSYKAEKDLPEGKNRRGLSQMPARTMEGAQVEPRYVY